MEIIETAIKGAWVVTPKLHLDSRGSFQEAFRVDLLESVFGGIFEVKQVNQSISKFGALRGIHYSNSPQGQAKYVFCNKGRVLDFIVDLRMESQTFGDSISIHLSEENARALLLSPGLGHGFLSLAPDSTVTYLCNKFYSPSEELSVNVLDPDLNLNIGRVLGDQDISNPIVSERDSRAIRLSEAKELGLLPAF